MKKYKFIVEKTDTGYSAYEKSLIIGIVGNTLEDLYNMALDAVNLYLGSNENSQADLSQIKFIYDIPQFFEYYSFLNVREFAKYIGMSSGSMYHYAQGVKKPSEKQAIKILNGIRTIGNELSNIDIRS